MEFEKKERELEKILPINQKTILIWDDFIGRKILFVILNEGFTAGGFITSVVQMINEYPKKNQKKKYFDYDQSKIQ